jgi:3-deoxy-D-manno-octulosonic-acid transferase
MGHWLKSGAARMSTAAAAQKTVDRLSGALERTLSQLDPYLMQLRIEHRANYA